jgi:hypothetical protein
VEFRKEGQAMSTVRVPDDLIAELRSLDAGSSDDPTELVLHALARYVGLAQREELTKHAQEREAVLTRAGISEEAVAEHFAQWRDSQRTDG